MIDALKENDKLYEEIIGILDEKYFLEMIN